MCMYVPCFYFRWQSWLQSHQQPPLTYASVLTPLSLRLFVPTSCPRADKHKISVEMTRKVCTKGEPSKSVQLQEQK